MGREGEEVKEKKCRKDRIEKRKEERFGSVYRYEKSFSIYFYYVLLI